MDHVEISVRDEGVGIGKEIRDNLFLGLAKSQPGTQNERGTGIGLLLTRSFISILKGKIEVKSEPGKGTVFLIILPTN